MCQQSSLFSRDFASVILIVFESNHTASGTMWRGCSVSMGPLYHQGTRMLAHQSAVAVPGYLVSPTAVNCPPHGHQGAPYTPGAEANWLSCHIQAWISDDDKGSVFAQLGRQRLLQASLSQSNIGWKVKLVDCRCGTESHNLISKVCKMFLFQQLQQRKHNLDRF